MGQQIHPIGLRVGVYRKWSSSWYSNFKSNNSSQSFGVIAPRGGAYFSGREDILTHRFKRYSLTKFTNTTQIVLVDFQLYKGFGGHTYGFRIYTKLLTLK